MSQILNMLECAFERSSNNSCENFMDNFSAIFKCFHYENFAIMQNVHFINYAIYCDRSIIILVYYQKSLLNTFKVVALPFQELNTGN